MYGGSTRIGSLLQSALLRASPSEDGIERLFDTYLIVRYEIPRKIQVAPSGSIPRSREKASRGKLTELIQTCPEHLDAGR